MCFTSLGITKKKTLYFNAMPRFLENLLRGRTSTFNTLAVILGMTYAFLTTFVATYVTSNPSKITPESLTLVKDVLDDLKNIILVILGAFIQKRVSEIIGKSDENGDRL